MGRGEERRGERACIESWEEDCVDGDDGGVGDEYNDGDACGDGGGEDNEVMVWMEDGGDEDKDNREVRIIMVLMEVRIRMIVMFTIKMEVSMMRIVILVMSVMIMEIIPMIKLMMILTLKIMMMIKMMNIMSITI